MNFDFPEEVKQLRDQARRFLNDHQSKARTRDRLEGKDLSSSSLWADIAALGWTGAAIPEEFGGVGLGHLAVCALAEELGYACAATPFSSSVYLATEALLCFGSSTQKAKFLPKLADGTLTGTFALSEGPGLSDARHVHSRVSGGLLTGTKVPVADAETADFAVVAAQGGGAWLHIVDLHGKNVRQEKLSTLDQSRPQARMVFEGAVAEALTGAANPESVQHLLDRAAVMMAFEQIGGAQAALEMARDYSLQRFAFGRPIGSFQAIKHKLADLYMNIELARSNCYYGAWALDKDAPELPVAAASARVAATEAAWLATKENIQTHGGMGYTWELDCHLYYRRAKFQALTLGSLHEWKGKLADRLLPKIPTDSGAGVVHGS